MASSIVHTICAAAALAVASAAAFSADEVEVHYGYYDDDGGLTVNSPGGRVSLDFLDRITVGLRYIYEEFEKTAPEDTMDAVSGATTVSGGTGTGFKESRNELGGSLSYRQADTTYSIGETLSAESDFYSFTTAAGVSQELLDKNLTLALLASYGVDDVEVEDDEYEHKYTAALTATATQLLSPTALILGGCSYSKITGYQESPLRKIRYEVGFGLFTDAPERHPDERVRNTVFVRGKKHFATRTALDVNVAKYQDDWGVRSHAVETRINQYITGQFILQLRHRFYSQTEADFYETEYAAPLEKMTADTRLRDFIARLYGLKGTLLIPVGGQKTQISLSLDKYSETNGGVTAMLAQAGLLIPF
jgi:hypothetical protein